MADEDLRRPIGEPIVLKHPPVGKVEINPLCPACASYVGNVLAADAVATTHGEDGRLEFGILGVCENCSEPMFTPFSAIYAELKRVGIMK